MHLHSQKHGYPSKYYVKYLISMGETKPLITKTGVVVSTFRQKSLASERLLDCIEQKTWSS